MQFMKEIRELRKLYRPGMKMPEKLAARRTAILWNLENYWSIDRQKQTYRWDAWNYPVRFLELARSFGAPVDIVGPGTDLSEYKVVIVPAYEMADTALVRKWKAYVAGGGHLIITCRTATKDVQGHFREGEWASALSGLIGAHITATDMMSGNSHGDIRMDSAHYYWNTWADLLTPDSGTDVLAVYNDQFYKGAAAAVKRTIGKGTVTYIGVATDEFRLERELLRRAYHEAGADTEDYPPGVYVYWRDGFYVAVNYSSEEYALQLPATARVLVGESVLRPGGVAVWSE
jgi:beta-galactosidase